MATAIPVRPEDVRDYTFREAARLAGVPYGIAWAWSHGANPLIEVPAGTRQWSFTNVVEMRVARALRTACNCTLEDLRRAVTARRGLWGTDHPLASERIVRDGAEAFFDDGDTLESVRCVGQGAMRPLLEAKLLPVDYSGGMASRMWLDEERTVVLDPRIRCGRPALLRGSTPIDMLSFRESKGQSIESLAYDFDLDPAIVRHAIDVSRSLVQHAA